MKPDRERGRVTLYRAAAVRDARGTAARPGVVAVQGGRIVAAGAPDDLPRRLRDRAQIVERPNDLLLPAMVNAHAHLDLAGVGPVPYGGDFADWLKQVMQLRPTEPQAIATAVREGLAQCREAGVGHVGDIAGSVHAITARQNAPDDLRLPGVSYLECFGLGPRARPAAKQAAEQLDALPFEVPVPPHARGIVLGLAPHAPYSAGYELYDAAARLSREKIYRLTTHLAESPEELQFVREAAGPFVELLESLGKWEPGLFPATGQHPIDWLEPALKRGRWLLAHCNNVEDDHLGLLARTGTSVAYCPIASDYFGHKGHRYREMLDAGVNVCLGTDSILCQPASAPAGQAMGILAQMRYLYRRDGTDPDVLLKMATTNGMLALELAESDASFDRHAPAIFAAVPIDPDDGTDPLVQALRSDAPVEPLHAAPERV